MKKLIFTLFLLLSSIGCMWAEEVTFLTNSSASVWSGSSDSYSTVIEGFTVQYLKNTSSTSCVAPSADHIRVYQNALLNISRADATITKVVLTCTGSSYCKNIIVDSETITANTSSKTITWEGSTDLFSAKMSAQNRITQITVTYESTSTSSVSTPVASVNAGTYYTAQSVELTCATEGADIYYTLDGSEPTETSAKYSTAITIEKTTTLKAVAIMDGELSDVLTKDYVIKAETPKISPNGSTFEGSKRVTITCATEGATIYYTTDGSDPTKQSTEYTSSFLVKETCTIKAKAFTENAESDVVSADFILYDPFAKGEIRNPYTVNELAALGNPKEKAWVKGYILGTAGSKFASDKTNIVTTSTSANTNIVIGDDPTASTVVVPVALTNNSKPKAAFNLAENPSIVGKEVYVYGSLESYFGTYGVKSTSDFRISNTATITSAEYATLYLDYPVIVPENVTAYYAADYTQEDANAITINLTAIKSGEVIPAFTGVVLNGAAADYVFELNTSVTPATVSNNLLKGVLEATTVEASSVMTLQVIDGVVGFYTYTGTTLAASKAYMDKLSDVPADISEVRFRIVENTTSIDAIEAPASDEAKVIYNLKGQRLDTVSGQGLYIINGKKVLVK